MKLEKPKIKDEVEKRSLIEKVEIRSESPEVKPEIIGYAARFNKESNVLGGWFVEIIKPGAFDGCLDNDVRGLINHDSNMVLGRTKSGTMNLEVDEFGLRYIIDPPETTYAQDLMLVMKRGDVDQSSFGFAVDYENEGDSWDYDEKRDLYVRTITKIKKLSDVSVVTYPAYNDTDCIVSRSMEEVEALCKPEVKNDDDMEQRRMMFKYLEMKRGGIV